MEMEGHKDRSARRAVGHDRIGVERATPRRYLNRCPVNDSFASSIVRVDLYGNGGAYPLQPLGSAGHGACVPVIEIAPRGQQEWVLVIGFLSGSPEGRRMEFPLAALECAFVQKDRSRMVLVGARPL